MLTDKASTYSSDAARFAALVKHIHRIPSLDDYATWRDFNTADVDMTFHGSNWKIAAVWFKDESAFFTSDGSVEEMFMVPTKDLNQERGRNG